MIGTGVAKLSACHPDPVSFVNVPWARSVPVADHRAPMWAPVFVAALWNRMPTTEPSASDVNFTPVTMEPGSPLSARAGVPLLKSDNLGVTAPLAADSGLVPAALVALTVKV